MTKAALILLSAAFLLCAATGDGAMIESPFLRIEVAATGRYAILDKQTGVQWASNPFEERFGTATFQRGGAADELSLDRFALEHEGNALLLSYLIPGASEGVTITMEILPDGRTVDVRYEPTEGARVSSIQMLENALWATDAEDGYIVVPAKVGGLMRADLPEPSTVGLYEDLEMWMLGVVKAGSAVLITWDVPYVRPVIRRTVTEPSDEPGRRAVSTTLSLRRLATGIRLHFLGKGDYLAIADAYREVARARGLVATWDEKLKTNPEIEKLFGAACFRIPRLMERIQERDGGERATVKVTFADAVRIAEHLKHDLELEKILMIMPGWIRWGYDNRHPDILPAAPECGGNEGFAEASRKIRELGYLFCPHDNYQDIYRDAPSWDEDLVRKGADGGLVAGGWWEGGQAYIACSRKSVELAERNLPRVKRLFDPNAYFIDTTFCVDLDECHDPNHPLTKVTDLEARAEMCDLTRDLFGVFGSEDGKDWAIPHSDFFEGLSCISGYHSKGGGALPFFEMVYHDCIVVYGKYGYDVNKEAGYLLHQLRQGMPLNYHYEPYPLYWEQPEAGLTPVEVRDGWDQPASCFCRADNGWAEGMCRMDIFLKNTHEAAGPLHEMTARSRITGHEFLNPGMTAQKIVFDGNVEVVINETDGAFAYRSRSGGEVVLPRYGFLIESPTFIAFHALSWSGLEYRNPVLFTLRSLDGEPIGSSRRIRVYHGFGDSKLRLGCQEFGVERESLVGIRKE
jgi:hypothetical protein